MKKIGIGLGFVSVLTILFYSLKNTPPIAESKLVDLEIKVVKENTDSPFMEGSKLRLKIEGLEEKELTLDFEGKATLPEFASDVKNKKISLQLIDTNFYRIVRQEMNSEKNKIILKAVAKTRTKVFNGRVVRYDLQAVNEAILDFGNGIAIAKTNYRGEFTVNLPENMVNTSVDLSIRINDREAFGYKILINAQILEALKVK